MLRVAVIGAGPAGLSAAYELAKAGAAVEVFEASSSVGGLAKSLSLWGQTVDLGPHRFFSTDARVNRLWLEVVGQDYQMVDRLTRIYYGGRFFHYPLQAGNALRNLGPLQSARCLLSYLRQRLAPSLNSENEATFESWVVHRFGRRLFEIFFKTYSEKLWGIPCQQLDADFAAQRIKKFSLGEAIKNAIGLGRKRHHTLVDRFAYPVGGTGMVYERMADAVRKAGGGVHLNQPIRRVVRQGNEVIGLELDGNMFLPFDHVISTMPLTLLVKGLREVPPEVQQAADALTFRNTVLVFLNVTGVDLFPDQWLYVHSGDLQVGRITNFRNWVPQLYGSERTSILALEYWCYDDDPLWTEGDEKSIERAQSDLRATGLLGSAEIQGGHVERIRRCYPVYATGYKKHLAVLVTYLRQFSALTPIGRYGAFKYNNQDHSILMGILAAENILLEKAHDLWAINTDYESYQESALITDTGLQVTSA